MRGRSVDLPYRGRVIELAQQNRWLVTRACLADHAVTDSAIRALKRAGVLRPVVPGLFSVGRFDPVGDQAIHATQLVIPTSAASGLTAARLHRFPDMPSGPIDIIVPRARRRNLPWVEYRLTRYLPSSHVVSVRNLRVTSIARTVCELARITDDEPLAELVKWLLVNRRMTSGGLEATARAWLSRGRHGSGRARRVFGELLSIDVLPQSVLEDAFLALTIEHDLPRFVPQFRPPWQTGTSGIADFGRPEERILIECDGRPFHLLAADLAKDRTRDRLAAAHGWLTLRYSYAEIVGTPEDVARELRLLLTQRHSPGAA